MERGELILIKCVLGPRYKCHISAHFHIHFIAMRVQLILEMAALGFEPLTFQAPADVFLWVHLHLLGLYKSPVEYQLARQQLVSTC